jgi:transcriptional regulator GlxA family with amidase domain
MQLDIMVYDGVDELDAIGPYEVFSNAMDEGASLEVALVSVDEQRTVQAGHGVELGPVAPFDPDPDGWLVVPGGSWMTRASAGAYAEAQRGVIPAAIAEAADKGTQLASVCTGGMLLASAGILDGLPATTHHTATDELAAAGAEVMDARVVDAGDIVTAGGVTAGLDLAVYLLRRWFPASVATGVIDRMEYRPDVSVYRV